MKYLLYRQSKAIKTRAFLNKKNVLIKQFISWMLFFVAAVNCRQIFFNFFASGIQKCDPEAFFKLSVFKISQNSKENPPVLEPLFKYSLRLRYATLLITGLWQVFSCKIWKNFPKIFCIEIWCYRYFVLNVCNKPIHFTENAKCTPNKLTNNLLVLVSNYNDVYLDLHSMEVAPD